MWSRRTFLTTVLASGVLAACAGGESDSSDTMPGSGDTEPTGDSGDRDGYTIVQRFPQSVQVPGELRLPISLATTDAVLVQDGPLTLGAQVLDIDGKPVGERIEATRRDADPAPYYAFRPTIEVPGFYALVVDGGPSDGASFDVAEPDSVTVPSAGDVLPPFDTPTTGDARGVDPICTREPDVCPFHAITLTEALAAGAPVVYYVGTPAFCSTGSCAPGLESLIEVQPEFGDAFSFVHAEVYADTTATTLAPAVASLEARGLFYEPVLFITDAAGVVVERIDSVWNTEELSEALNRAIS
jgi:hypothetical protein